MIEINSVFSLFPYLSSIEHPGLPRPEGRGAVNKILKMNMRERDILLKSALFEGVSSSVGKRLLDCASVASHEARDILFREGDNPETFYCVLSGYVRLYRLSKDGREADIGLFGPGEIFGECLMFMDNCYRMNAQTAESATIARFDIVRVRHLAEKEPDLAMALMGIMARHLQQARDNVANDRLHTAPQRVANYILENCPADQQSVSFRLPFQKSLLAGKLGLAPEALSRAFSLLKNSGVSVRGRVIQINDVDALRKI